MNIALAIVFALILGWGVYGLAWAQAIVAGLEVSILFAFMSYRIPKLFDRSFHRATRRMIYASIATGVITYGAVKVFDLSINDRSFATTPKFAIIVTAGLTAYVLFCKVANLKEANIFLERFNHILFVQLRGRR